MGTINYATSDYITIGFNCDYDYIDEWEKETDLAVTYEIINELLEKYNFYYYHVTLEPGYYEGFYIDIERNFIFYDDYVEKQEAQKEVTQLKNFLLECINEGMVQVYPGWCTGYEDHKTSIKNVKEAIKNIRLDIKITPTYRQYKKEC
jgi:hypothetical protein